MALKPYKSRERPALTALGPDTNRPGQHLPTHGGVPTWATPLLGLSGAVLGGKRTPALCLVKYNGWLFPGRRETSSPGQVRKTREAGGERGVGDGGDGGASVRRGNRVAREQGTSWGGGKGPGGGEKSGFSATLTPHHGWPSASRRRRHYRTPRRCHGNGAGGAAAEGGRPRPNALRAARSRRPRPVAASAPAGPRVCLPEGQSGVRINQKISATPAAPDPFLWLGSHI